MHILPRCTLFAAWTAVVACEGVFSAWLGSSQRTGWSCPPPNSSMTTSCCTPAALLDPCSSDGSLLWSSNASLFTVVASPILSNASLIIADVTGNVLSFNARNGGLHWAVSLPGGGGVYASPLLSPNASGIILAATASGNVTRLATGTGQVVWSVNVGGGVYAALASNGGDLVYGVVYPTRLVALHMSSGVVAMSMPLAADLKAYSAPAVMLGGSVLLTQVLAGNVFLSAYTGKQLAWQVQLFGSSWGPVVYSNAVYTAAADVDAGVTTVTAFLAADGSTSWSVTLTGVARGACGLSAATGTLVVAMELPPSGGITVHALSLTTGHTVWTSRITYPTNAIGAPSSPLVTLDASVVLTAGSSIFSLNGSTGAPRWRYDAPLPCGPIAASPALGGDGVVYVALPCGPTDPFGAPQPVVLAFNSMPLSQVVLPPYPSASPSPSASPTSSVTPSISMSVSASPAPPPPILPAWSCSSASAHRSSMAPAGVYNLTNLNQIVGATPFTTGASNGSAPFIIDYYGTVYMYDATLGSAIAVSNDLSTMLWSSPSPCSSGTALPPTLSADGLLYLFFTSANCISVALNVSDGSVVWSTSMAALNNPTLSVSGGVLLVSTVDSSTNEWIVTALDHASGSPAWSTVVSSAPPSIARCDELPLSPDGQTLLVADDLVGVSAFSVLDGSSLWVLSQIPQTCAMATTIKSIDADVIMYPDTNGMMNSVQIMDGSNMWSQSVPAASAYISRPSVSTHGVGTACASDGMGNSFIYTFRILSGVTMWVTDVPCSTSVSPTVGGDGTIYAVQFAADGGPSLTALSNTGTTMWGITASGAGSELFMDFTAPPVIAPDGALRVSVVLQDSTVVLWKFATASASNASPSPMPTQPPAPPGGDSSLPFGPLSQTQVIIIGCVGGAGVLILLLTCCARACKRTGGSVGNAVQPQREPLLQPPPHAYEPPVMPANYYMPLVQVQVAEQSQAAAGPTAQPAGAFSSYVQQVPPPLPLPPPLAPGQGSINATPAAYAYGVAQDVDPPGPGTTSGWVQLTPVL